MKKKILTPYQRVKKYRIKHPQVDNARIRVYIAIRNKTLRKTPCIECGNTKSEAHHEDYSKPLEVIWLCKKHHVIYDSERRLRQLLTDSSNIGEV